MINDEFYRNIGEVTEESTYCRYVFHDGICFLKTYKNILSLENGLLYLAPKMKFFYNAKELY